jgi:hypothetical protein
MAAKKGIPPGQISAAARVTDGWMVGLDGGEFGGSLWWLPIEGRAIRLIGLNVRSIVVEGDAVLVLTDDVKEYDHVAALHRFGRSGSTWRLIEELDLDGEGQFAIAAEQGMVLVLTSRVLLQWRHAGTLEKLLALDLDQLYPNSIVRSPDGVIHVGMRHFVLRLFERDQRWHEEWLLPRECAHFGEQDEKCICEPAPSLKR